MVIIKLEPKHLTNEMIVTPDNMNEVWMFCQAASTPMDAIIAVNMALNLTAKYMEEGFPVCDEGEDNAVKY